MTSEFVISLAKQGMETILLVSLPLLLTALAIGLLVSVFQATTQIQEQTLAFVPKIVGVFIGLIFFGPWMLSHILSFAFNIFNNLYRFVG